MYASEFIIVAFALSTEFVQKPWVTASIDHVCTDLTYPAQTCAIIPEHLNLDIREKWLQLPWSSKSNKFF